MRSSLFLGVALLLTITTTSIVEARKTETSSRSLGSGTSACKCAEVVVKSAKVQKPLYYASPEAINQAAAVRSGSVGYNAHHGCGWTGSSSSSSSISHSSSSSSSSNLASSSSSVNINGGLISGGGNNYPLPVLSSNRLTESDSDCGCEKKSGKLEVHDLLSPDTRGTVVPSFEPIGDLCYPSSPHSNYQVTTKVTPAYPGKIRSFPATPYEVCVQILNGQIDEAGLKKLKLATGGSIFGTSSAYTSNVGSTVLGGHSSSSGLVEQFGGKSYGSHAAASANSLRQLALGTNTWSGHRTYGSSLATSSGVERVQELAGSYSNDYDDDFGNNPELPENHPYSQLPADSVSINLAYKNLFPRTLVYNRRGLVSEDKLSFGHRTVPTESAPKKKTVDVPEEKLQILEKPVIALNPSWKSLLPHYNRFQSLTDKQEEVKLAELEAIEREKINREQITEQTQGEFVTYGQIGYEPIGVFRGRPKASPVINAFDEEDGVVGASCAPVGPPVPDYIPGSVMINRELMTPEAEDDVRTDEPLHLRRCLNHEEDDDEDDIDDPTSGIFARLKSAARKSGPTCGSYLA